jgi:hypothetical protein
VATANPWQRAPDPFPPGRPPVLHSVPEPPRPAPVRGLRLWRPAGCRAALFVVGASGGCGETTLATLLPDTVGTGHRWPSAPPGWPPARTVLIGRTTPPGLEAVQAALAQYARGQAGNVALLAVVLSADAPGRRPHPLQRLVDRVAGGAPPDPRGRPRVLELPWIDAWRLPATDTSPPVPDRVAPVLRAITDLLRD